MRMKNIKIIFVVACLLTAGFCFADTIVFKSGKTFTGDIIEETRDHVTADFYGQPLKFYQFEIERIERGERKQGQPAVQAPAVAAPKPGPAAVLGPVVTSKDTAVLMENIAAAQKNTSRYHMEMVYNAVTEIFSMKTQEIVDIDHANKTLRFFSQVLDLQAVMPPIDEAFVKQAIGQDIPGDTPEAKLEFVKEFEKKFKQQMDQMTAAIKQAKSETVLDQDTLYLNLETKWVKMQSGSFNDLWLLRDSKDPAQDTAKALSSFSEITRGIMGPLVKYISNDVYEAADIESVNQGDFRSEKCYVLSVRKEKLQDAIKDVLKEAIDTSSVKKTGPQDIPIKEFSYSEYVSADDFLSLGADMKVKARVMDQSLQKEIDVALTAQQSYDYPSKPYAFSSEDKNVVTAEDESDLKAFLKSYIDSRTAELTKGAQ